jgi:ferric-dicitrate binding protein FerR (iron transport regulator)
MIIYISEDTTSEKSKKMINKSEMNSLLRKFVENKASEDEIELLQEYLKTPIGLNCLDQIINEYAADFEKAHLVQSSYDGHGHLTTKERNVTSLYSSGKMFRAVAATFLGMLMLTSIYFYISKVNAVKVYKTIAGQKSTIILPDNTIVTLNGESSLSYRGDWKEESLRSVSLTGEGYFKVTSNPQKPFVVNTSGISIKVLGTTFNVKSYDNDEAVETTLVEGKVVIEKDGEEDAISESIELLPDQKAIFTKNSKQIVLENVKPESEAAWVKGSLVFEDEPFSEIVKDLERWYGTKIIVKDKASLQCRFNTRIENESLEEVLKLFSSSGNVKYSIDDNQVWIEGSLCNKKAD